MQFLKRLFCPNRLDAFVIVLVVPALLCFAGMVGPSLLIFDPMFVDKCVALALSLATVAAVVFAAIGVAAGWNRCSVRRSFNLILGLGLSAIVYFSVVVNAQVDTKFDFMMGSSNRQERIATKIGDLITNRVWILPAALVGGFAIIFLTRNAPAMFRFFNQKANLTRQKFLVLFAVGLFLVAMLSKLLGQSGVGVEGPQGEPFLVLSILNLVVFAFVGLVLIVLPSWVLLLSRSWKWKACLWGLLFAATAIAIWQLINGAGSLRQYELLRGWLAIGSVWLFLVSLLAVSVKSPMAVDRFASESEIGGEASVRRSALPSVWSVVLVLPIITACSILLLFEPTILLDSTVSNRWKLAREARKVMSSSGSRLLFLSNRGWTCGYWQFTPSTPTDVLKHFDKLNDGRNAIFQNFDTGLVTSFVKGVPKQFCIINNGKITTAQLDDLCDGASGLSLFDVNVVDVKPIVKTAGMQAISLHCKEPGQLTRILESLVPSEDLLISINSEITRADWPAVARIGQICRVQAQFGIEEDVPIDTEFSSLRKIQIHMPIESYDHAVEIFRRPLFRETDISATTWGAQSFGYQQYWDLYFATAGRLEATVSVETAVDINSIDQDARDYHWAFGFADDGSITELFIPSADSLGAVAGLTELRALSFDANWMRNRNQDSFGSFAFPKDLSQLAKLTKLESLYLSDSAIANNLDFLTSLTSLKHLQILAADRQSQTPTGFDACPSLETVTLFGKPDGLTVMELGRLPKLKTLTVVDLVKEGLAEPKRLAALKKALPNVEVRVMEADQLDELVPESFKQHREMLKRKLGEQIFDQ